MNLINEKDVTILLANIFYSLIVGKFNRKFFLDYKSRFRCIPYIAYWILISAAPIIINSPTLTLVTTFFLSFLLTLFYSSNVKNKLIAATFITVIAVVSELAVAYLLSAVVKIDIFYLLSIDSYTIFVTIVSKFLFFALTSICLHLIRKKPLGYVPTPYWLVISIVPICSVVVLYTIFVISGQNLDVTYNVLVFAGIVCVIVINMVVFILYDKTIEQYQIRTENELLNKQLEYYDDQNKMAMANYNYIRQMRHDINEYMICFNAFLESGNVREAQTFVNDVVVEMPRVIPPISSGNIGIDAIINYKNNFAMSKNIHMDVNLNIPANLIINALDISIILGNAINNAIEAVAELDENRRLIKVSLSYNKGNLFITISNPFLNKLICDKSGEFRTSKPNKRNHGIGIKSIKSVVEKHYGNVEINTAENIFTLEILLYDIKTSLM